MALTTGTTWDLVLSDAPRTDDPAAGLSARAAYQQALFGRAVIVDLRTANVRAREGEVDPTLKPVLLRPSELPAWLAATAQRVVNVLLLSADGTEAAVTAATLAQAEAATQVVRGGFSAWRQQGMPVAS